MPAVPGATENVLNPIRPSRHHEISGGDQRQEKHLSPCGFEGKKHKCESNNSAVRHKGKSGTGADFESSALRVGFLQGPRLKSESKMEADQLRRWAAVHSSFVPALR